VTADTAGRPHARLVEREVELATVQGVIGATQSGRLLGIEGPAGIGKTALLAETKALGRAAGMDVLAGRGSELERSYSYGVVRQLFEPFLAAVSAGERAELLAGAAGLAAPLFDPVQLAAEADASLATLHGLYWLTANIAARGPLLLVIDDLHWSDLPSLRWLAYLLPRIEGIALSVVVALRPTEPGTDAALLSHVVSDPLATVVRPAPLTAVGAAGLLQEILPEADDGFCATCYEQTGGNPLLLRELARAIAAEGSRRRRTTCADSAGSRRVPDHELWRSASAGCRSRPPGWHGRSRSWATTQSPGRLPSWRGSTTRRPPQRRWRWPRSTSSGPPRRWRSSIPSSERPSTNPSP
jgi:hypothetical protein